LPAAPPTRINNADLLLRSIRSLFVPLALTLRFFWSDPLGPIKEMQVSRRPSARTHGVPAETKVEIKPRDKQAPVNERRYGDRLPPSTLKKGDPSERRPMDFFSFCIQFISNWLHRKGEEREGHARVDLFLSSLRSPATPGTCLIASMADPTFSPENSMRDQPSPDSGLCHRDGLITFPSTIKIKKKGGRIFQPTKGS